MKYIYRNSFTLSCFLFFVTVNNINGAYISNSLYQGKDSLAENMPIGSFIQITESDKNFVLVSKKITDSIMLYEFTQISEDTSLDNARYSHFYFTTNKNNKIIGGIEFCNNSIGNCSFSCTKLNDSTISVDLFYDNMRIFDHTTFQKTKVINLRLNDGLNIDPDYFYRLKNRSDKSKHVELKFFKYPSIFSNNINLTINDSLDYQFLVDHLIYCELINNTQYKFIYIGFVDEVEDKSIFKDRYSYEHEYWISLDDFNKYFEHF